MATANLLRYGIPRVFAAFTLMLLFAAPAMSAARNRDLALGGLLAFGLTVVGAFGSAVGPIGTVILPKAAALSSVGQIQQLRQEFRIWRVIVVVGSAIATVVLIQFDNAVLRFFVPQDLLRFERAFDMAMLAIVPYSYFCLCRPIVDAWSTSGHNARALFSGLLVYAIVNFAMRAYARDVSDGISECVGLFAGIATAAFRTHVLVERIFAESGRREAR